MVLSEDSEDELAVDDELLLLLLSVELLSVDALLAVDTLDTDSLDDDAVLAVLADELLLLEDDAVLADVPLVLRLDSLLADWLEDDKELEDALLAVLSVLSVLSVDALLAVELLAVELLAVLWLLALDGVRDDALLHVLDADDSSSRPMTRAKPPPLTGTASVLMPNKNGANATPSAVSMISTESRR